MQTKQGVWGDIIMKKASMGARFGALILDSIFLNIINSIILFTSWQLFFICSPFITFLYYGICEGSSMSATLGKRICGLVVVDEYGNKLTSAKGFTRSVCRIVSGMTLGIGYLIALFDENGKALHDKMAKTFVAEAARSPEPQARQFAPLPPVGLNNPNVICITGQLAGKAFNVTQQGIMFGRDSNVCNFAFPENTNGISRLHSKLVFNPQTQMFVLYDLGSTYGTFLENGTRVTQEQPIAIKSGEGFYLAARTNLFRVSL
jgi:uncharacterized RDD family membrane protein YckC